MSKLNILIPTLNEPYYINRLRNLLNVLQPQVDKCCGQVNISINDAGRSMPTGTKRNELIKNSDGEYFVQIDSDDMIPPYYVEELLKGIVHSPDVISFVGYMSTDGHTRKDFTIRIGEKYEERNNHYYRYCNHLCCYKRSIVEHVKFRPIWQMEDYYWATEIRDKRLLKSEYHISDKWMYHYAFDSKKNHHASRNKIR